ncbi:MAG: c-type cytochrome [Mariprofundaceae bacterium]|nr:c-type cytochrome [Mariprofundaceae bacterium]
MRTLMITLFCTTSIMAGCGQSDTPMGNEEGQKSGVLGSATTAMDLKSIEGYALIRSKCASCHSLDSNRRKPGPTLKGIMGKKPSISGLPYEIWTEAAIDEWIESPTSVKKHTRMAIPGIKDAEERRQIISFLKHL